MDVNWKEVGLVGGAGGVGGALSLIYATTVGVPPVVAAFPWGVLAYMVLGAGSGVFGVYLIAKTDTRQVMHCLVFAAACGVSWAPIFDGVSALVKNNRDRAVNAKAAEKLNDTKLAIRKLEGATDKELPAAAASMVGKFNDLLATAPEVTDRQVSFSVAQSVQNAFDTLQKVQPKNPAIASKATKELAASVSASGFYGSPTAMPFPWSGPRSGGVVVDDRDAPWRKRDGGG